MPGTLIGKNVTIKKAIIGENAIIGDNAVIDGTDEVAVVGNGEVIGVKTDED
jgi:glucose-1-phosphate adenylyltransferase